MKKFTLTLLLLVFSATAAFAHCGMCGMGEEKSKKAEAMGMKDGMKEKMGSMFEGLDLTDEQKAKVEALKETKHNAIKAAKDKFKAGVKEILTPEQLKIFEGMHADHSHE